MSDVTRTQIANSKIKIAIDQLSFASGHLKEDSNLHYITINCIVNELKLLEKELGLCEPMKDVMPATVRP